MGIGNDFIGDIEELISLEVLKSKKLFRFSKEDYYSYSFLFEKKIKEMFDASGVLLLPSATISLLTFLNTIDLEENDEVIVPPFSWVADYSVFQFKNLKLRICKINKDLQVEPNSIKELINDKTKIVLIPHMMGRGQQEIDTIAKICHKNNIFLIEDIAQSFGVKIKGKYAGMFGDFSFSSMNHHKIISTGDGGFGIFNNMKNYEKACQFHDQGCFISQEGKRKVNEEIYTKGLSLRVNNLTAGIARSQLARLPLIKKLVLEKYHQVVDSLEINKENLIQKNDGDIPYTMLLKKPPKKDYPSLLKSGWHYLENIPYFNEIELGDIDKLNLSKSKKHLDSTYSYGTGFLDKYFAIKDGVKIKEEIDKELLKKEFDKK